MLFECVCHNVFLIHINKLYNIDEFLFYYVVTNKSKIKNKKFKNLIYNILTNRVNALSIKLTNNFFIFSYLNQQLY